MNAPATSLKVLNIADHPVRKRENQEAATRQHLLRRIGAFELIDGEFVGHIATMNFSCKSVIKANPYKTVEKEPEYIVEQMNGEVFHPELGFAWEMQTGGQNLPYLKVHLDDPSFSKTIVAVLLHGHSNLYFLYWDRVTITENDIEDMIITEELQPYTGVYRRIAKPTEYLISIYPSLQEIYAPDEIFDI